MNHVSTAPLIACAAFLYLGTAGAATPVFINEIHYDNAGTDTGEAVEVAGPAGTDLTGWTLQPYNGNGGTAYSTIALGGIIPDQDGGYGTVSFTILGLQNGSPDGIALVDDAGGVRQFLSYEGSFVAADGPAVGLTSTDIGVFEPSDTPIGQSLQLTGAGTTAEDFAWNPPAADSFDAVNAGQSFGGGPRTPVFINEIHYDNAGTDADEGVEIAGPAGTDLAGWTLQPYNGATALAYSTTPLAGILDDLCNGYGALNFPILGLQNGSPDGVALVDDTGAVVQFLSYEGTFFAADGPAVGLQSRDIGVFEASDTPLGLSLQLQGDGTAYEDYAWAAGVPQTAGAVNAGQSFAGTCPDVPGELTAIYLIQGSGAASPLVGQTVRTQGVVTGDFQEGTGTDGDLRGFFVQDPTGDGDPATSDGIFVFQPTNGLDVNRGDLVEIVGVVSEYFGRTELTASTLSILAAGTVAPAPVTLPASGVVLNADGNPVADLERYEGMLITFPQTLAVTELFNLDRFGELRLAEGGRFFQFTQTDEPDVAGYPAHLEAVARRNLTLDDGLFVQNADPIRYPPPGLDSDNPVRMGDTVTGLTGVLDWSRGSGGAGDETWRLHPTMEPVFTSGNPRPAVPAPGGSLTVASFNVLNYYTTIDEPGAACYPSGSSFDCRGADSLEEFDRQRAKLVTAIGGLDADIVGLVEIENNYPDGAASAIADLVDGLNTAATGACGSWDYVDPGAYAGDDTIAVGVIFCTDSVSPAPGTSVALLTDADLPGLGLTGPIFDGQATNRSPLAASFREIASGEVFTLVVNHFKSKGASGLAGCDPATEPDCDQGDGQSYWNALRVRAAEAVSLWLATDPTGSGDPDALIVGDLNAYRLEDPVTALVADGYADLLDDPAGYTFVFDGQAGTLDHALASSSLAGQVAGAAAWHINSDESDGLDYNLDFGRDPALFDGGIPYRASDHDPVLVGLDLGEDGGSSPTSDLLDFFDAAVAAGELTGRPIPYRQQLIHAQRHYHAGRIHPACVALENAYRRADKARPPKDFIDGPAREALLAEIESVQSEIGCRRRR